MKLEETLKIFDKELLQEAIEKKLVTSFKSIKKSLPPNWIDSTKNISPFGSDWGRGVISRDNIVIVSKFGIKHAMLKQRLKKDIELTFYWGYIAKNETLYLELASIRGSGFNRTNVPLIASAILDRMKYNWKVTSKNIIFEN